MSEALRAAVDCTVRTHLLPSEKTAAVRGEEGRGSATADRRKEARGEGRDEGGDARLHRCVSNSRAVLLAVFRSCRGVQRGQRSRRVLVRCSDDGGREGTAKERESGSCEQWQRGCNSPFLVLEGAIAVVEWREKWRV